MLFAGTDVGSVSTEVALVDESGALLSWSVVATGPRHVQAAENAMSQALSRIGAGPSDVGFCVSTGYGRRNVPFSQLEVTEIACHARGAAALHPQTRLVIDVGGQDSKAIRVGPGGRVMEFAMNDKCAAGTGRFLEVMARTLEVELADLGELGSRATRRLTISSMCTVFAESEVISRIAEGCTKEDIVRGLHLAIAERLFPLISRVGRPPFESVTMTGGVAKNRGVVAALEERLGCTITVPDEPQVVGALGAALLARAEFQARRAGSGGATPERGDEGGGR
ncbi:MAG: acyl-CoA dehydratase activase [Acetobacteraceae bacterium]|nr:acyl-CoA dehydratase activase [Acetobacteraceae bacterium]